jgi:Holliday junction resolvase-like predicted endonuclease
VTGCRARTSAQLSGDAAEDLAAAYLVAAAWRVLGRNLRVGRGELDILAIDPGPPEALVAVEVRWRRRRDFGLPEETFDWRKRRHVRRAMFGLLERGRLADGSPVPALPVRFDLVVVEPASKRGEPSQIRHHRHAVGR